MARTYSVKQIIAIRKKGEAKAAAGGEVVAKKPMPVRQRIAVRKAIEARKAVAA